MKRNLTLEQHVQRGTTCLECGNCRELQYYTKVDKKNWGKYKGKYVCLFPEICEDKLAMVVHIFPGYICEGFCWRNKKLREIK